MTKGLTDLELLIFLAGGPGVHALPIEFLALAGAVSVAIPKKFFA